MELLFKWNDRSLKISEAAARLFAVYTELFIENETFTRIMERERLKNKGLCLFHLLRIFETWLLFLSSASSMRLRLFGPISFFFFSHNLSYGTIELFSFQGIGMRFGESFLYVYNIRFPSFWTFGIIMLLMIVMRVSVNAIRM